MGGAGELRFGSAQGRWVLVATVLASGMAFLDTTAVNVALPRLADDLGATFGGLQWVVNGYLLTLAALILFGGSLGDRLGRRRIFTIGVVWFATASLLCGVAWSAPALVAFRVLQGIGAALLTPGSLAIIQATFARDDRGPAIGAWAGLSGIAAAVGPFVGGWLVDAISWRAVFFLNLPVAAVVVVAVRHVPETKDGEAAGALDLVGAGLATAGLAAASFGLIERSWLAGTAGAVVLAAFVSWEARTRHPMLPLDIFDNRRFSATNVVTLVVYGALGLLTFLLGITLQTALGYSPLEAGAALFPVTLLVLVGSVPAGALAERIGPRLPMTLGPLLVGAGMALLVLVEPGRTYAVAVLPGTFVFGAGLALTVAPLTATVLASAPQRHVGIASGVNNAVARTASLVAVASIPVLAGIDPDAELEAASLVDGLHRAAWVGAALAAAGALVSALFVGAEPLDAAPGEAAGRQGAGLAADDDG